MNMRYSFFKAKSGEIVPAITLPNGETRPLHSTVDPRREAQRLVSAIPSDIGFVVFLGLGGGFACEELLVKTNARVLAIDFDSDGIKELLSSKDYSALLQNKNFTLLQDCTQSKIKYFIMENYNPALCGGIKIIPLLPRTEQDSQKFNAAAAAIEDAVKSVSADYSVQTYFGLRWFSNIIRNVKQADNTPSLSLNIKTDEAAIVAAGPSLDSQIKMLSEYKSRGVFIISTDTAMPVLFQNNIEPDIVVSIDCQHFSYYHFIGCRLYEPHIRNIPLCLDIASPPMLRDFSCAPIFFSSGHPLSIYISQNWKPLPILDTSGGNVTYACLSLAENLRMRQVTLFGADFAYLPAQTYAKASYIYPYFEKIQSRFSTLETQHCAFFYRAPFLPPEKEGQKYKETSSLRFYREKLEEKAQVMSAGTEIYAAPGQGAPIKLPKLINLKSKTTHNLSKNAHSKNTFFETSVSAKISGTCFLEKYHDEIKSLPAEKCLSSVNGASEKEKQVFTTLLPTAAAIKHRNPLLSSIDLIEETKHYCVNEIERVLE